MMSRSLPAFETGRYWSRPGMISIDLRLKDNELDGTVTIALIEACGCLHHLNGFF